MFWLFSIIDQNYMIFKKKQSMFMFMCDFCVQKPWEPDESTTIFRAEITYGYESACVGY